LREAILLAALSCFFKAALLAGATAFLRAFLMREILTEMCLGAFLAFEATLANDFLTCKSLALISYLASPRAFLRDFLRAATFLASLSCFFKRALLTGFYALASLAFMAAILALIGLGLVAAALAAVFFKNFLAMTSFL